MRVAGKRVRLEHAQVEGLVVDFRRNDYSHLSSFQQHVEHMLSELEQVKIYATRSEFKNMRELQKFVEACFYYHLYDIMRETDKDRPSSVEGKLHQIFHYITTKLRRKVRNEKRLRHHKRPAGTFVESLWGQGHAERKEIRNGRLIKHLDSGKHELAEKAYQSVEYLAKVTRSTRKSISKEEFHAIAEILDQFLDSIYDELELDFEEETGAEELEAEASTELVDLREQAKRHGNDIAAKTFDVLNDKYMDFVNRDVQGAKRMRIDWQKMCKSREKAKLSEEQGRKPKGVLVVISDMHIAKVIDHVEDVVGHKFDFLNSNRILREAIDAINGSRGVVGVIVNGDSVDYYYEKYIPPKDKKFDNTNWEAFEEFMARLRVPYFVLPGNHEHRCRPFNFGFWGMEHLNVPEKIRDEHKDEIGHHKFRWLREPLSVLVNKRVFNTLEKTPVMKCPCRKNISGYECIFLNTGSDGFVRPKNAGKYAQKVSRMAIGGSVGYDSDGLEKKDLKFVEKALARKKPDTVYIFMHCPVMNSKESHRGQKYDLDGNFEEQLARGGLNYDTIINNGGKFFEILRRSGKNIIIITSHTHNAKYYLIDKDSFEAAEVTCTECNRQRYNPKVIKQVCTWPLGGIYQGSTIGYLRIHPDRFEEVIWKKYAYPPPPLEHVPKDVLDVPLPKHRPEVAEPKVA